MDSQSDFGRRTWVRKGSKFSFSGFGSGFGMFLSSGYLEEFKRVQSLVMVDKPGFEVLPVKFEAVLSSLYFGRTSQITLFCEF